jgi:hypothetical protein
VKYSLEKPRRSEGTSNWFVFAIRSDAPDGNGNGFLKTDGTISQWLVEPGGLFPSREAAQATIDRYNASSVQPKPEQMHLALESIIAKYDGVGGIDSCFNVGVMRNEIETARELLKGNP